MFVALNEVRKRIFAQKDLPTDVPYYCPVCGGSVRLRAGSTNAPHFAHITVCTDDFTHDMSDWHREWQELFPEANREIVIEHNGEVHRADVLCYGTVIEFQHSPISEAEFQRRNKFYTAAGYKLIWIFDLIEAVDNKRMWCENDWESRWDSGGKFNWNYPWRFLNSFLPQDEKNIDVFFQIVPFGKNPKDPEEVCYMEKIVWVNADYKTLWGKFRTSVKVTNYAELLAWLQKRQHQATNAHSNAAANTSSTADASANMYSFDGKVIGRAELLQFLDDNKPYHIVEVGARNNPRYYPSGALCGDPHQKPYIQEGHCTLGCYACLALVEDGHKKYVVCKSPLKKGEQYEPKYIQKLPPKIAK